MHILTFSVDGMTCSSCSGSVERTLRGLSGVEAGSVSVSVTTNSGRCVYDETAVTATQIVNAIETTGYDASVLSNKPHQQQPTAGAAESPAVASSTSLHALTLGIEGMTCTTCSGTVERTLRTVAGVDVSSVSVSLATNTAKLTFDTGTVSVDDLAAAVEDIGFGASILTNKPLLVRVTGGGADGNSSGGAAEDAERRKELIVTCVRPKKRSANGDEEEEEEEEQSFSAFVQALVAERVRLRIARLRRTLRQLGIVSPASRGAGRRALSGQPQQYHAPGSDVNNNSGGGANRFTRANVGRITAALARVPGVLEVNATHALGAAAVRAGAHIADAEADDLADAEEDGEGGGVGGGHIVVTVDERVLGPRRLVALFKAPANPDDGESGSVSGLGVGLDVTISSLGGFLMAGRMLQQHNAEMALHLGKFLIGFVFTLPILIITMILPMIDMEAGMALKESMVAPGLSVFSLLLVILTTPVQYGVGWAYHRKAYRTVRAGTLGMDFLISSGTNAAYAYSFIGVVRGIITGIPRDMDAEFFETAAVLITVVLFGKVLELYAKGRTALAIHKLNSLKAKTARLVRGADEDGTVGAVSGAGSVFGDNAENGGEGEGEGEAADSPWRTVTVDGDEEDADEDGEEARDAASTRHSTNSSANGGSKGRRRSSNRRARGKSGHDQDNGGELAVGGGDRIIDAALLQAGDIIRLVEGESVPADGEFISPPPITIGVDESMMTGESRAVYKTASASAGAGSRDRAGGQGGKQNKGGHNNNVYGGTLVIEGSGLVRVTACGDDSTLGRIVSTVQEAQSSKPPIQEIADAIAALFVPAVAVISLCTFFVWFIAAEAFDVVPLKWVEMKAEGNVGLFCFLFALAVWVSACPCAFGLATPTAILVSTGLAAKSGILIRRGAALQYAAEVSTVAFDKTGTLTYGRTEVTDCLMLPSVPHNNNDNGSGNSSAEQQAKRENRELNAAERLLLLYLLRAAEERSAHPISKGIVKHCAGALGSSSKAATAAGAGVESLDSSFDTVKHMYAAAVAAAEAGEGGSNSGDGAEQSLLEIVTITGCGIKMIVHQRPPAAEAEEAASGSSASEPALVLVGNARLLRDHGVEIPESVMTQSVLFRRQGKITVYFTCGGVVRAIVALSDIIRPESAAAIAALQKRHGIECYMITGDDEVTALAVAGQLGLSADRVFASQKPEDKQSVIKRLQAERSAEDSNRTIATKCVAFVGDGTNDSPALAQADVGFAMAGGTDIAVETGDMVLCKADLTALVVAIDLSKTTLRRIILNYVWAFIYNILLVPLAAGVLFPSYQVALDPMLAGAAMALSSVSIVVSSLSLSFYKPPHIAVTPPVVDGVLVKATSSSSQEAAKTIQQGAGDESSNEDGRREQESSSPHTHKKAGGCCGGGNKNGSSASSTKSEAAAVASSPKSEQRLCGCVQPSTSFVYSNLGSAAAYRALGGYVSAVLGGEPDELAADNSAQAGVTGKGLELGVQAKRGKLDDAAQDEGDGELVLSEEAFGAALGCKCGCSNCRCGASCQCYQENVGIVVE